MARHLPTVIGFNLARVRLTYRGRLYRDQPRLCRVLRPRGKSIAEMTPGSYFEAFFFSVQTLATVGYGHWYPQMFTATNCHHCRNHHRQSDSRS